MPMVYHERGTMPIFIELKSWDNGAKPLHINVNAIAAIYNTSEGFFIATLAGDKFKICESPGEVMEIIRKKKEREALRVQ